MQKLDTLIEELEQKRIESDKDNFISAFSQARFEYSVALQEAWPTILKALRATKQFVEEVEKMDKEDFGPECFTLDMQNDFVKFAQRASINGQNVEWRNQRDAALANFNKSME